MPRKASGATAVGTHVRILASNFNRNHKLNDLLGSEPSPMWIEGTVVEKMFGGLLMVEWKVGGKVLTDQAAGTSLEIIEIGLNPPPESIPAIPIALPGAAEAAPDPEDGIDVEDGVPAEEDHVGDGSLPPKKGAAAVDWSEPVKTKAGVDWAFEPSGVPFCPRASAGRSRAPTAFNFPGRLEAVSRSLFDYFWFLFPAVLEIAIVSFNIRSQDG